MIDHYLTIQKDGVAEIEIKKSRFICSLKRVETEDEAKLFIQRVKKEHWKATHNCSAFVVGDKSEIKRSSDDGEPSGTAGIPMLEVLVKKDLINVAAVVTRYFGGTKLGAGGLIRAYSHAVSHGIDEIGIVEGKLQQEVSLTIAYPLLGKLQNYLENNQLAIKETLFTDEVVVVCSIDEESVAAFEASITELLSGQVQFFYGQKTYNEILLA
ncbi:YigZ family protein [Enterococcus sp. MJM12]|uniref:YigZ family protein n=1 Tax=Candidatus Enterococcus myersii TaxID=2815322 RepID=A0ABS3H8S2_9ENTE|nr:MULTISPECIES: YigZ family protein [unclassified Enterococcus]MBO0449844.1 YigZ family protein [Enterococcus sp. MJM12]MCD1023699.1 YigZ family protein [Enterococcus sp. SMC-9]